MSVQMTAVRSAREQYTASLRAAGLDAPWMEPGPLIKPKASAMQARAWRWRDIEPLIHRSPEFMAPGRGAERRILRLDNPGVPERTAGHTISVAVQYLLPGEVAPAHRPPLARRPPPWRDWPRTSSGTASRCRGLSG